MGKKKKYSVGETALSTIGSTLVAMIFASLIIFSMGTLLTAPIWLVVVQCLAILIFVSMVYSPAWYCGDHDSNAVHFGRMQEDLNKGLHIGLLAMIPFALTPLLLVVSKLQWISLDLGFVYRILNVHMLYAINALVPPDSATADTSWLFIIILWLYNLIIPATTFVAYRLGYAHISISERLIFKNLPKNTKNKRR